GVAVHGEVGIVPLRGERERSATLPSPDHLRAEQRLFLSTRGLGAEVPAVGSNPRLQLSEDDVGAGSAEPVGGGHRWQASSLVRIAKNEFARLDGSLPRVRRRNYGPLHGRLADSMLQAEGGAPSRELIAVLPPDHFNPRQPLVCTACPLENRLQPGSVGRQRRQRDVDIGAPEWLLPIERAALAHVS